MVTFLFSMPFVLFSMTGGWLADHFSKRQVTIWTKVMEIGSMTVATAGLAMHSRTLTLVALGLVATQAALFGPSKYGLLPELLPAKRLSWGNGVIELGTFLAIIVGTVTGAAMAEHFHGHEVYAGYALLGLACIGLATSLGIDRVPAAAPEKKFRINFLGDLWQQIKLMRRDQPLFLAVLGNTYFWFLGSLLFSTVVVYGPDVLHIGQTKTGYLNAALAIGIGIGSMIAGLVSGNKIEYGLIPLGSIGMTCTGIALGGMHVGLIGSAVLLAALGFWAGFFAVPVNALIQHRPAEKDKGGIIAAANLLSFVGIALSSGVYYVFTAFIHLNPRGVIVAASFITAVGTVYVLMLLPEWFGRLILFFLTHTIYRVKVLGRDNFPEKTGALLVCNHMSFVDVVLLIASTDRPIRFLMYKGIYDNSIIKPFAKMMKAIPISSEQRPREMIRSLRTASDALREDEIVCIFAEGQITRTGQLLPFRRGLERIMKGVDVPIIPVNLDGVWGSIFSFERGRFLWKMPQRIPYPVTVSFGTPMPPTSTAIAVRRAVQELQAEAFQQRKRRMKTLDRAFVRTARRFPLRFMMADGKTPRVPFRLGADQDHLHRTPAAPSIGERQMVGIAAAAFGRRRTYQLCADAAGPRSGQSELHRVERSHRILRKAMRRRCSHHVEGIRRALSQARDSRANALSRRRIAVAARHREASRSTRSRGSCRRRSLRKAIGARPHDKRSVDDLATVIFSSGSTGDPKGVMLTHFNIVSNIQQVSQVFMLGGRDKILGILPFFHSFGFMAALWMPAVEWRRRRLSSQSARHEGDRRTGRQVQSHIPHRHADISAGLHAALLAGKFRQPAICSGRRGKAARARCAGL